MTTFSDQFGGSTLTASQVAYRELSLAASMALQWPQYASQDDVLARIMNFEEAGAGLAFIMPDARDVSPGYDTIFVNSGAYSVQLLMNDGFSPIALVAPGERRWVCLADNSTANGTWLTTLFGVGTGTLDIAGAAGAGLSALGTQLNLAISVVDVPANKIVAETDRATAIRWTGGTGTLTLPLSGSLRPRFFFEVRNQGTGALTLAGSGGGLIDGVPNLILNVGESCFVHAGTGSWMTIGRGRPAQFNFTQLQKTVTGGTVNLTLTEASNVVQTYTGALISNVDIVLPAVVQVYYISNQTSGAFNFRLKNPGSGGATVSLPSGQNAIVFSDGINVINAATTVAGIGQLTFGAGTVSAPSVAIGATNTGLYAPTSTSLGVTAGGALAIIFDATGALVSGAGNRALGVKSTDSAASVEIDRPAGAEGIVTFKTAGVPRWQIVASSAAESGGNAGSNLLVRRLSDAGAILDTPLSINRATGVVSFLKGFRDPSRVGQIVQFVGDDSLAHDNCLLLNGALVSRATYPDLWAYAQTTSPVSEAAWTGGQSGRFSVGDGATTFRVPDLRGVFTRGLDSGRGLDTGRAWGTYQDHAILSHNHGVNDPTHNHGVSDPGHAHGVYDPGHAHSGSTAGAGAHSHQVTVGNTYIYGGAVCASNVASGSYTTGGVGDHAHAFSTNGAGTGIGIYGSGTGIGIYGNYTGISIQNAGGADLHPRNVAYPYFIYY